MTLQEFNTNFDLLYNNIASNQAPGLDEYEKSVFLTNAQLELVKNYFNPKGNKYQEGFDQSPKRQLDFSTITDLQVYNITDALTNVVKFNEESIVFPYNDNFLFIIQELATVTDSVTGTAKNINIRSITNVEYMMAMNKPYKYPFKHEGWRIIHTTDDRKLELLLSYGDRLRSYKIRYIKRPTPIILTDLSPLGLTIDGISAPTDCILDEAMHAEIVQRAVELAKMSYDSQNVQENIIQAGARTE